MVCESMCQRGDGLAVPSASCALVLQLLEHTETCCLCGLCAVCVNSVLFVWTVCCLYGLYAVCKDSTFPDPHTALGSSHELLWPDTAVLLHH